MATSKGELSFESPPLSIHKVIPGRRYTVYRLPGRFISQNSFL